MNGSSSHPKSENQSESIKSWAQMMRGGLAVVVLKKSEMANDDLQNQAQQIAADLQNSGAPAEPDKEIIALIAYLQRLGTDIKAKDLGAGN